MDEHIEATLEDVVKEMSQRDLSALQQPIEGAIKYNIDDDTAEILEGIKGDPSALQNYLKQNPQIFGLGQTALLRSQIEELRSKIQRGDPVNLNELDQIEKELREGGAAQELRIRGLNKVTNNAMSQEFGNAEQKEKISTKLNELANEITEEEAKKADEIIDTTAQTETTSEAVESIIPSQPEEGAETEAEAETQPEAQHEQQPPTTEAKPQQPADAQPLIEFLEDDEEGANRELMILLIRIAIRLGADMAKKVAKYIGEQDEDIQKVMNAFIVGVDNIEKIAEASLSGNAKSDVWKDLGTYIYTQYKNKKQRATTT